MNRTGAEYTDSAGVVLRSRDLADLAGTTPRALRHYHQLGLLPEAPRDPNGYRRYGVRDLVRLLRIRQLAAGGMPLREIGGVLDRDVQDQDELLAKLDRDLEAQQLRIDVQRKLLAELRERSFDPRRFSVADHATDAQRFDQDVWTLVTASGQLDAETADAIRTALHSDAAAENAAEWYLEFEGLDERADLGDIDVERLAQRIADFAGSIIQAVPAELSAAGNSLAPLISQMASESLSPAQQKVWNRFLAIVDLPQIADGG